MDLADPNWAHWFSHYLQIDSNQSYLDAFLRLAMFGCPIRVVAQLPGDAIFSPRQVGCAHAVLSIGSIEAVAFNVDTTKESMLTALDYCVKQRLRVPPANSHLASHTVLPVYSVLEMVFGRHATTAGVPIGTFAELRVSFEWIESVKRHIIDTSAQYPWRVVEYTREHHLFCEEIRIPAAPKHTAVKPADHVTRELCTSHPLRAWCVDEGGRRYGLACLMRTFSTRFRKFLPDAAQHQVLLACFCGSASVDALTGSEAENALKPHESVWSPFKALALNTQIELHASSFVDEAKDGGHDLINVADGANARTSACSNAITAANASSASSPNDPSRAGRTLRSRIGHPAPQSSAAAASSSSALSPAVNALTSSNQRTQLQSYNILHAIYTHPSLQEHVKHNRPMHVRLPWNHLDMAPMDEGQTATPPCSHAEGST